MENVIYLRYNGESFPAAAWKTFLKYFNVNKYTGRSDPDFPIWNRINGKGFHIWVSEPVIRWEQDSHYWLISIITNENISEIGKETLALLIDSAISQFENFQRII